VVKKQKNKNMAKTTYKVAPKMAAARKKNGGEDPTKKGPGPTPLPGALKAPTMPMAERIKLMQKADKAKLIEKAKIVKNTSERFKKEPTYNVKDAAKRGKGDTKAIEKDLSNTRSRMGTMYQEGKITRSQLKDSIKSTMDVGTRKADIKAKAKEVGGRTKAGQVLFNMGVGRNKAKGGKMTMVAETRERNCSKPGKGF
jgi:hypothetical protein